MANVIKSDISSAKRPPGLISQGLKHTPHITPVFACLQPPAPASQQCAQTVLWLLSVSLASKDAARVPKSPEEPGALLQTPLNLWVGPQGECGWPQGGMNCKVWGCAAVSADTTGGQCRLAPPCSRQGQGFYHSSFPGSLFCLPDPSCASLGCRRKQMGLPFPTSAAVAWTHAPTHKIFRRVLGVHKGK